MIANELILLVDDDVINLHFAQAILSKQGYHIAATRSGAQALTFLGKRRPDLILLDIKMPGMDGFETLSRIREMDVDIPVVFLTADINKDTEVRCFSAGALDFINKPFVAEVLLSRVRRILDLTRYQKHLERMVAEEVAEITKLQDTLITGIATLIESRDTDTGAHVLKAQRYVRLLADELMRQGLYPDILTERYADNTFRASVLHDVGKINVRDSILCKPGRFTPEEYAEMKNHAAYGGDILGRILGDAADTSYIEIAVQIARHHHERWDGKGYPDGLAGEAIPLCARIMALADVTDALISERCYKKPIMPVERVFEILEEGAGTQFDPTLTAVFLSKRSEILAIAEA